MDTATTEPRPSVVERLNLRWLNRLLTSSVGRKFVMGATGLGLCGFLVVHLAGNLLLYGGPEGYDRYAHMLHEQEWLPLAEAGLFLLFFLHIYLACATTWDNRQARNVGYSAKQTKQEHLWSKFPVHNWMFISGAIILGFLILHIIDMKLEARGDIDYVGKGPAAITFNVLLNPISAVVYVIGTIFLLPHLWHGFSSAFQSLGLSHPKYTPLIKVIGYVFAVVIAIGFCSLPVAVRLFPNLAAETQSTEGPVSAPVK
jgi:succinate dehydrogenase / fumarate reductase cytochrome b subunit